MLTKEQYNLICFIEENAEIVQRACKALRFGLYEKQPGQELDNLARLQLEFSDLITVSKIFDFDLHAIASNEKADKLEKYYQYSKSIGIVE